MPVNSTIIQQYKSKTKNGDDYTLNASDYAVNLVGNVAKPMQVAISISVDWYANADAVDTWNVKATTLERTTGNFLDDGFYAGQKFAFISAWTTDNTTPIDFEATIDSISSDGSLLTFTVTSGAPVPDLTADNVGIRAIGNASENELTGFLYRFGFIENNEPFNTTSKIANVDNRYQAKNVGLAGSTAPVDMDPQGTVLTWQTGSATAAFVSNSQFQQNYVVVHEFVLNPWYLQGQNADIAGNVPPDYFSGNRCLKHVFEIELRADLSNPNQSILIRKDDSLGFTGWLNENFNGEPADYQLQSIAYEDTTTADSKTGLQPDFRTTATIVIQRLSGNFASGTVSGVLLSFLASQSRYQSTVGTATDAFLFDAVYHTEGTGPQSETNIIKSVDSSFSSDLLTITIEVEYTSSQALIIENGSFMIAVDVADQALSNQASDSVSVLADINDYTSFRSIDGLLTFTKFDILTHNQTAGVDLGATSITAWNQDGILIDFAFDLDLAKTAFLNNLLFKLVAYDTVTDTYFNLDSYSIDTSGFVVSADVQQIEVDTTRGYILANNDQFNDVIVTTGSRVADIQSYSGYFAQKIKWQDWLQNLNANAVFYDASEPNDNLNFKSSNYSNLNNYEIRLICESSLTGIENGLSGTGAETGQTGNISTNNYGVSDGGWTAVMSLHDPDTDTDTGFVILQDKDTVFRVTWENVTQGNDLSGLYAIHRIQQSLSAGDNIQELSSVNTPVSNRILKPMSGEVHLKVTQLAPDSVVTECLIDKDKINPNVQYNLSYKIER